MAKILLVEDDNAMREVMNCTLTGQGFECEQAENGRVGLEKLCAATVSHDPYDCILLDIAMPEVDGWQFLQAVKNNPLWKRTKVVVLTGYAISPRDVARASALDCVHFEKNGRFLEMIGQVVERVVAAPA